MDEITGFWRFSEEFDYGRKAGEARLFHSNNELRGTLIFKEWDQDNEFIMVRCQLRGELESNKLMFKDQFPVVLLGKPDDTYLPEEREGVINELGQIVGTVTDADGVNGIFVMEKIL